MKKIIYPGIILIFFLVIALKAFTQPIVLITYYSKTGNTKSMAEAVAKGAHSVEGITIALKTIEETTHNDLIRAHAIILGSPVYNANVAPQMQEFISKWPFEGAPLKNKLGAAFVTAGGISAGEEITMMNMLQSMLIFGMVVVGGPDWKSPFGASAIVNEAPFINQDTIDAAFLQKGEDLGRRVGKLVLKMKD